MSAFQEIANIWRNVREVDLRPIRQQALYQVKIALVGEPGSGRYVLAEQFRRDPKRAGSITQTPMIVADQSTSHLADEADLIFVLVSAAAPGGNSLRSLASRWHTAGKKVFVFYNTSSGSYQHQYEDFDAFWTAAHVFTGPVDNADYLIDEFVPLVLEHVPDLLLSLGRHFPLFRVPIAEQLINDTSFSNAAYILSTSLAEMVPVLGVPVNIADMIVLTKSQAFLVYRLGLLVGFSTRWQDYVSEFSGVIGSGFVWRQLARGLVGLIPVVGVVPKVAVAYDGTFVVGHVV
ncbi:MAG: hypothetical protein IBX69_14695, partial [Anaerolineales bacterium]|nr:hypothetical protein [Anaerolineales bacterium]